MKSWGPRDEGAAPTRGRRPIGLDAQRGSPGPRRPQRQVTGRRPHGRLGDGGDRRPADPESCGLPTEKGRLKVQTDFRGARIPRRVRGRRCRRGARRDSAGQNHSAHGSARYPTGKGVGRQRVRQPRVRKIESIKHHDMGLVVDLGPHQAVANPLKIQLSGFPAKSSPAPTTCMRYLVGKPMGCCAGDLTDALFARSVRIAAGSQRRAMPSSRPARYSTARKMAQPLHGKLGFLP